MVESATIPPARLPRYSGMQSRGLQHGRLHSQRLHSGSRSAGPRPNRGVRVLAFAVVAGLTLWLARHVDAATPVIGSTLEHQLLLDAGDGRLDTFSFLDASLIASGVDQPHQLTECRERFASLCERFREQHPQRTSGRELAAALLAFLHREVLTEAYQIKTTRVDQALLTGHYNCVASTILFRCLSDEFGEAPVVVATSSHVFCRFMGPERLDVETTCPDWFGLPPSSAILAAHPANQSNMQVRDLSDVEVLGKLYYNRATDKLDVREFAEACALLRTSLTLDPADAAARENLLAAINNWSLQRCAAADFDHAARLIAEGTAIAPDYLPFQMNDLHIHQQWALDLCQRQQFAAAARLLERGYHRRPDAELFDQGRFAIYGLWADAMFAEWNDDAAWQCLDQARRRHPGRMEVEQRETASILRAVERRLEEGHPAAARTLLDQGIVRLPHNVQLKTRMRDLTDAKS